MNDRSLDGTDLERGKRLQEAIEARGIKKMYVFAMELAVSESTVSRWKTGAPITVENLIRLCGRIDISVDWLLLGRGHMDGHQHFSVNGAERRLLELLRPLPDRLFRRLVLLVESISED